MKRVISLVMLLAVLSGVTPPSLAAADRQPAETKTANPIRLEGQIRQIEQSGDGIVIRLQRGREPLLAHERMRVRSRSYRTLEVRDLLAGDIIRVDGDLDRGIIHVNRVELLRRDEQR